MRTTVDIDDDVLLAAKKLARERSQSLGEVISSLAREGLHRAKVEYTLRDGVPVLVRTGSDPVTPEMVRELQELD